MGGTPQYLLEAKSLVGKPCTMQMGLSLCHKCASCPFVEAIFYSKDAAYKAESGKFCRDMKLHFLG